jgi:hypothetical protein
MGCFACQTFWTALAVHAITRGAADPTDCLLTAAAYSGAAVMVQSVPFARPQQAIKPSPKGSCGTCGK